MDALSSTKQMEDKRLRTDLAVLKDMPVRREIADVAWVPSEQQLADCSPREEHLQNVCEQ